MHVHLMAAVLVGGLVLASTAGAGDIELGKKIYGKRCAACHGPDGKGNTRLAEMLKTKIPDLITTAKNEEEMLRIISKGKRPMPAFGKKLSNDELRAVVDYVKSLVKSN